MGSSPSRPSTGNQTIVIIGFSYGGQILLENILHMSTNMKVVLVDKNESFETITNIWESLYDEQGYEKNSVKFQDVVKAMNNQRVSFKQGLLKEIQVDQNMVVIETPSGEMESVQFDVLVLSTGSSYNQPWRGDDDKMHTTAERQNDWNKIRLDVKDAKSVLCIGGGPTAIESAAFIKSKYPDKPVGLATRGDALLSNMNQQSQRNAFQLLKKAGVDVFLNTNYFNGAQISIPGGNDTYDYILECAGFKFWGPTKFMQGLLIECLDRKTG